MTNTTETNLTDEQISNLMDSDWGDAASGASASNEVDNLVHTLQSDPACRQKWARYHLARDVMQNEHTPGTGLVLGTDFASKVASAIEAEPAIVAFPANNAAQNDAGINAGAEAGNVSTMSTRPAQNWQRNVTGLAVAASVALVSVVGLNIWRDNNADSPAVVAESTINPELQKLSAGAEQLEFVANRGTYWKSTTERALSQQNEEKLNMFLSQQIENVPTSFTGMVPYSRLVGYDKVRGDQD